MTEIKTTAIPRRQRCIDKDHPYIGGAKDIYDDANEKNQETINSELIQAVGTGGSVDSRIAAAVNVEKTRAEGAESTLTTNLGNEVTRATNAENALDGRVDTLEDAVGTGGSVDSRISAAVATETIRAQGAESNLSSGKADKATTLAGYGITDAYTKSETYTKTEVNGLVDTPHQEYVTVDAYANLPATGSKDTIYRVSNYNGSTSQVDASVYSEYAWDGTQYVFLCVKSQIGEVFDISVYNNNAKYADLAAALNGGANIPQSLQKGGMSVKFVQSSDNKYVQARCMAQNFTTDITQWQGADTEIVKNSDNLAESGAVWEELNQRNVSYEEVQLSQKINDKYIKVTGALENAGGFDIYYIACHKGDTFKLKYTTVSGSNRFMANYNIYSTNDVNNLSSTTLVTAGMSITDVQANVEYTIEITSDDAKLLCIQDYSNWSYVLKKGVSKNKFVLLQEEIDEIETNIGTETTFNSGEKVKNVSITETISSGNEGILKSEAAYKSLLDAQLSKMFVYNLTANGHTSIDLFDGSSKFVLQNNTEYVKVIYLRKAQLATDQITLYLNPGEDTIVSPSADYKYIYSGSAFTLTIIPLSYAGLQNISEEADIKRLSDSIEEKIFEDITDDYDDKIENYYLNNLCQQVSYNGYEILLYNVSVGDVYTIRAVGTSVNNIMLFAEFGTNDKTQIGFSTCNYYGDKSGTKEITFVCKKAGMLAVVNGPIYTSFSVSKQVSSVSSSHKPVRYKVINGSVYLSYNYDAEKDIVFLLEKRNANNLFEFSNICLIPKMGDITDTSTRILTVGTDWNGPFIVAANQNADGDNENETFTGGNHDYNGHPTARTSNVVFLADNVPVSIGEGYCNKFRIEWINYIQAYNTIKNDGTGREVMAEIICLDFNGETFSAEHSIVPLENITISKYYGMQFSSVGLLFKKFYYLSDTQNRNIYTSTSPADASIGTQAVRAFGDYVTLEMGIDDTFDLGERTLIQNNDPWFLYSSSKIYSYLINGNPIFYADKVYKYKGYWKIQKVSLEETFLNGI